MSTTKAPRLLLIVAAIATLALFFLPWIRATGDTLKALDAADQLMGEIDGVEGLRFIELKNLSLFDYTRIWYQYGEQITGHESDRTFGAVIYGLAGGVAALALLTALWGKATITLLLGAGLLAAVRFVERFTIEYGILGYGRDWGISHTLYYPVGGLLCLCAVWLFVAKHNAKKAKMNG